MLFMPPGAIVGVSPPKVVTWCYRGAPSPAAARKPSSRVSKLYKTSGESGHRMNPAPTANPIAPRDNPTLLPLSNYFCPHADNLGGGLRMRAATCGLVTLLSAP